jgi:hypothetical protein
MAMERCFVIMLDLFQERYYISKKPVYREDAV